MEYTVGNSRLGDGTPVTYAAERLSAAFGCRVSLVGLASAMPENGFLSVKDEVDKYGVASRFMPDGSLAVHVADYNVTYDAVQANAVFQVAFIRGVRGFLPTAAEMRRVASHCGLIAQHMSETDVTAYLMSCAHDVENPTCRMIARKILEHTVGIVAAARLDGILVRALKTHRRRVIWSLQGRGKAAERRAFARECLSRLSSHVHLHLGFPEPAYGVMGYRTQDVVCRMDDFRKMAERMGMTAEELVDAGILEEMADPMVVLKKDDKDDVCQAVFDIRDPEGRFLSMYVAARDAAAAVDGGIEIRGFGSVSPASLASRVGYIDRNTHTPANVLYARPVAGQEPKVGAVCATVLGVRLEALAAEMKKGGTDGKKGTMTQLRTVGAIQTAAKVIKNFRYPKVSEEKVNVAIPSHRRKRPAKKGTGAVKEDVKEAVTAVDPLVEDLRGVTAGAAARDLMLPVRGDGRPVAGAECFRLLARMLRSPQHDGCNMFVTSEEAAATGLSVKEGAECVTIDGAVLYNLMDTDMTADAREAFILSLLDDGIPVPPGFVATLSGLGERDLADGAALRKMLGGLYAVTVYESPRRRPLAALADDVITPMMEVADKKGFLAECGFSAEAVRGLFLTDEGHHQGPLKIGRETVEANCSVRMQGGEIHVIGADGKDLGSLRQVCMAEGVSLEPLRRRGVAEAARKVRVPQLSQDRGREPHV